MSTAKTKARNPRRKASVAVASAAEEINLIETPVEAAEDVTFAQDIYAPSELSAAVMAETPLAEEHAVAVVPAVAETPAVGAKLPGAALAKISAMFASAKAEITGARTDTALSGKGLLNPIVSWVRARRTQATQPNRLRVSETVSLGEKRFVSVLHVDGRRYLIGGSASNVALLTQLDTPADAFGEVLRRANAPRKRTTSSTSKTRQVAQ